MGILSGLSQFGVNMDDDIYGDNKAKDNAESDARAAKAEAEAEAARKAAEERKKKEAEELDSESFGLWGTIERIRIYTGNKDAVKIRSEVGEFTEIEIIIP